MKTKTQKNLKSGTNPTAIRKAAQAAGLLAKAANLMREAEGLSDDCAASGRYDFAHWAIAIEELLSCDNGEAGIGPALTMITKIH